MNKLTALPGSLSNLPIADVAVDVIQALQNSNVLLQAEPGAGKSTGLPLVLLQTAKPTQKIVMLEPRRLAARSVAERLASQLGEPLGQRIGLRMRGDSRISKNTVVEVVTEGVLTRLLQSDPELNGIGLVIFDEFHERSLHADLGLALCLEVQNSLRDDLRLLFMSATLNSSELADHLNDNQNPSLQSLAQINAKGRQFPVSTVWSAGFDRGAHSRQTNANKRDALPIQLVNVIVKAIKSDAGDVLVFLPGVLEIERTANLLEPAIQSFISTYAPNSPTIKIYRLHSQVSREAQRLATAPASESVRRIILSTSIAETSLTIDGVQVVIDSGLERRGRCDNTTNAMHLETVSASQASATQRSGRAGRTAAGICYRLWSEADHVRRPLSWQAEIHRADLSTLLLELTIWGVSDPNQLPWLDTPPVASINRASDLLNQLGILDGRQLTKMGECVSNLPIHPRLGAMLCWANEIGCLNEACKLASILEEGSSGRHSDLIDAFQHPLTKPMQNRIKQLLDAMSSRCIFTASKQTTTELSLLVAKAYPDWIARRRAGNDNRYTLACGAGVYLAQDDSLAQNEWLAIARMGGAGSEARVFLACALNIDTLLTVCPELFNERRFCDWDDKQERVVAEQQVVIGKLVVSAKPIVDIKDDDKRQALLQGIRKRGLSCLPWTDECRQWQIRVGWMKQLPEHCTALTWPDVDDDALMDSLENWLSVWLGGKTHLKALQQLNLYEALNALLSYEQQQELEALLPSRYEVPSGSKISLEYTDQDVVLSVKLQEMFGCKENPNIAKGHIPLKVALLSPARRPVQITSDLVNFWVSSYPAVKKDMAGRYPKHPWPDDPANAIPTARAKPRRR